MTSTGHTKIGDFGSFMKIKGNIMKKDVMQCTNLYMSPEQHRKEIGLKSDMWSLGVAMY